MQCRKVSPNSKTGLVCKSRVTWQDVHLVQEKIHWLSELMELFYKDKISHYVHL